MSFISKSIGAVALAAVAVSTPAMAGAEGNGQLQIHYKDLNLSTKEGVSELDRRIAEAAESYCGANTQVTGTRVPSRQARVCVKEVKASAAKQFASIIEGSQLGG